VIPNGLPFDEIEAEARGGSDLRDELGLAPGTPLVGFVGKDSWQKNVRRFLAVAAQVGSRVPAAHFAIVGWRLGPADRDRLGVSDPRIHMLGTRGDVYRVIRSLDVLVMTSETEGCPNVVLEAAGLGVPVVAPDVGDIAVILGAEGRPGLVPGQDVADYAARTERFLSGGAGVAGAVQGLAARVRGEYDVARMVERSRTVFRDVRNGRR
jgi:glycosyltransferase involved in cell wall biosynthesis